MTSEGYRSPWISKFRPKLSRGKWPEIYGPLVIKWPGMPVDQSMPTFVAAKMIPVPMYQGRSAARAGPRYTSTLMSSYS